MAEPSEAVFPLPLPKAVGFYVGLNLAKISEMKTTFRHCTFARCFFYLATVGYSFAAIATRIIIERINAAKSKGIP